MSEDPKPSDVPPGSSVPATPSPAATPATGSTPAQPAAGSTPAQPGSTSTTAPLPARPSAPPIDILMPTPKKPFTIPPYAGCFVKMTFGFGVLLIMGYCALVALNPRARQWATQGAKDGSGGPTPFNALNQILAIPAQAIGKTKDVVAASDARVGVLNNVIADDAKKGGQEYRPLEDPFSKSAPKPGSAAAADKDADDKRISRAALLDLAAKSADTGGPAPVAPRPVAPVAPPPPPGPAELKLAGGVVLTNSSPAGAPAASAPFMYWAAGLTISGVSNSTPPRFLMNGRLVQAGDEVNRQLGVTFDHLDAAAKLIHFRDKGGAVVTRSY